MDLKSILQKITELNEAKEETTHKGGTVTRKDGVTVHKGKYGTEYQGDDDEDGEKKAEPSAEKRGRGRPKKAGGEADTSAKYQNSASLQSLVIGNVPKKSKELEKLPKTKHKLKDWFEMLDKEMIAEAEQVQIVPAKQNTQVIKQGEKTLGTIENPTLAATVKQAIGKGEMSLAGDELGEEAMNEKWDTETKVAPSEKGKYEGKSKAELLKAYNALKKSGPHKKGSKEFGKMRELAFAIRAKSGWGKVDEVEQPTIDNQTAMGAGLGAGRSQTTLESKKAVKKDDKAEKAGKKVTKDIEYDEKVKDKIHGKKRHAEDEKAEKAGKKVAKDIEYDEKKKLKEAMTPGQIQELVSELSEIRAVAKQVQTGGQFPKGFANKLEAVLHPVMQHLTSHTLKEGKVKELSMDMDELSDAEFKKKHGCSKAEMKKKLSEKPTDKKEIKEGMDHRLQAARLEGKAHGLKGHAYHGKAFEDMEEARMYHEGYKEGLDECYGMMPVQGLVVGEESESDIVDDMASFGALGEADMEEGNAFTAALAKTPKGGKFTVGGKTFTDRTDYDSKLDEFAFESLDKQLNALLEGKAEVAEGMTVSISKGQQGMPDTVSVSAQDTEAEALLGLIKQAGLGLFDKEESSDYGAPKDAGMHGDIKVVDDHDGMMALMKKMTGSDTGSDYEEETDSTCEVCHEAPCGCESKEMVDEVETEDQMTYEVAEDNAPDSDEAETSADEEAEAKEDEALAMKSISEEGAEASDTGDLGVQAADEEEEEQAALDESYANSNDDTFEADIDFMTKVISGGLNKQKSTGQTTIPVIASQGTRQETSMRENADSVQDWKALAGIK